MAYHIIPNLVSIIVPVHNRPLLIHECVESAIAQTYRPIEVIIVDDGSSDSGATATACQELVSSYPGEVFHLYQANGGPGIARETGRQHACGEFIAYLDSDDVYYPRKIALQVSALREYPDRDIAYGCVEQRGIGDRLEPTPVPWGRSGQTVDILFPDILRGRHWCTSCPLYRRSLVDRIGAWTSKRDGEDLEYDVRAACVGARAIHIPEFLVRFRHHPDRISLNSEARAYQHQAQSRWLICDHIMNSGIPLEDPAVQHFAQGLFLYARQIGAMGLINEAEQSFVRARRILRQRRGGDYKSYIYNWLAHCIGYRTLGIMSERYDNTRNTLDKALSFRT